VTALTSGHTATWVLPIDAGTWEGQDWHYDGAGHNYQMWEGGTLIATLSGIHMDIYDDPQVVLNFSAHSNFGDMKFVFTSALVSFGALSNPTASASAGITLTDNNFNGALLAGQESNGAAYWANYNGLTPGGTNYASFFNAVSATALEGTHTDLANMGPTPLAGSVSSMSAQFDFMLSAFDAASGTSNFNIVPAPGALALLGLGGLVATRRRR